MIVFRLVILFLWVAIVASQDINDIERYLDPFDPK